MRPTKRKVLLGMQHHNRLLGLRHFTVCFLALRPSQSLSAFHTTLQSRRRSSFASSLHRWPSVSCGSAVCLGHAHARRIVGSGASKCRLIFTHYNCAPKPVMLDCTVAHGVSEDHASCRCICALLLLMLTFARHMRTCALCAAIQGSTSAARRWTRS